MFRLKKQINCPACQTSYFIGINQLTLSHGWVSCAECKNVFNAIERLYKIESEPSSQQITQQKIAHNDVERFFYQKINQSNIDLIDYLDGLDYRLYRKQDLTAHLEKATNAQKKWHHHMLFIIASFGISIGLLVQYFFKYKA